MTELTFFWPNMGMTWRGVSWKILKIWHKSNVFLRGWTCCWEKYGHKSIVFLENGRFFDKIWAWEQIFFRGKSEKSTSYRLFGQKYSVVLTEFTIFNQIWARQPAFFHQNKKNDMRVFLELIVFWKNMGMRAVFFR